MPLLDDIDSPKPVGDVPEELIPYYLLWWEVLSLGIQGAIQHLKYLDKLPETPQRGAPRRMPQKELDHLSDLEWLKEDADYVGSFGWCCRLMDIDPGRIRDAVLENWRTFQLRAKKEKNYESDDVF